MQKEIAFEDLTTTDLIIDSIYKGNTGDDPLNKIMKCGNQGGFRYTGSYEKFNYPYISSMPFS